MNKILVATVILLNENKKFLMEQKNSNFISKPWQFPGGKVNPNEAIPKAAVRELKEELDIIVEVNNLKPFFFTDYMKNNSQYIIFYFLCKDWLGKVYNKENQSLDWFSLDEAIKVDTLEYNLQALKYISKFLKNY